MAWTTNPQLLQSNVAPKELFQAVCDELGAYYETKGLKYTCSRPKITYKDKALKVVIGFWSSRNNTRGEWVNLEIVPSFYSLELIKNNKSTSQSKLAKGLILGHVALLQSTYPEKGIKRIQQIDGTFLEERKATLKETGIIITNHNCNIQGLDETKFKQIIQFINQKILAWIPKLKTAEGILEFIEAKPKQAYKYLLGKSVNSDFVPYCDLTFPELKVKQLLK